jgi:hypothetical protein
MYNHLLYFAYWLFNSLVLYVFGLLFPGNVVLGNWRFGPIEACIYAGFWVTFFIWVLWDFALAKGVKFDTGIVTLGYFWSANIFAFWIVSRFSEYAGLGITNYLWAFAIGLSAYAMQRLAWNLIAGRSKA